MAMTKITVVTDVSPALLEVLMANLSMVVRVLDNDAAIVAMPFKPSESLEVHADRVLRLVSDDGA